MRTLQMVGRRASRGRDGRGAERSGMYEIHAEQTKRNEGGERKYATRWGLDMQGRKENRQGKRSKWRHGAKVLGTRA